MTLNPSSAPFSDQPVAVVTSILPSPEKSFHGATLSSRMAASLRSARPYLFSHMVINILSDTQASTAALSRFSRPDHLHPHPFGKVDYYLEDEGMPFLEGSLGGLTGISADTFE
ncbi:hypothetical protein GYMLUDRAFT_243215 [Collybiopsis luxurians FD-317 M1]|uniref:Flavin reductase like domain-containing protein n=1 Tax=Collybiopsis luxurians FD-317 M1 TaxID=944289 RepID=A0A0D0CZP9_9AGAR|nr:hypothetical protein GYMLUDRAFT_243215 [Collybiopsis luxurians FD-317 M1]